MSIVADPFNITAPADGTSPKGAVAEWLEGNLDNEIICNYGPGMVGKDIPSQFSYKFDFVDPTRVETGPDHRDYLAIDDYFSIAFEVYLAGELSTYVPVKLNSNYVSDKMSRGFKLDNDGKFIIPGNFIGTGARGRVFLWIKKPFIGKKTIPYQMAFTGSMQSDQVDAEAKKPIMQVYFSGAVTSTATCEFTEQVYAMEFGDVSSSSIGSISKLESNPVGKALTINLDCSKNISAIPMTISLVGPSATTEHYALSTSHPDIGIAVKANNKLVTPMADMASIPTADQQIETQTNGTTKSATIQAYPVKLANKVSAGEFKSSATLRVDFK